MTGHNGSGQAELLIMHTNNLSLWDFATGLYSQDRVSQLCLELQDEYDQDVCLLLFLCWYGQRFGLIEAELLARCQEFSRQWQDAVVAPLRQSRRWLKSYLQAETARLDASFSQAGKEFRESVKEREQTAERLQLERLQGLVRDAAADDAGQDKGKQEGSAGSSTAISGCLLALLTDKGLSPDGLQEKLTELATAASRFAQSELES
jgi:uncharacterized protein (TIGR02444 family)